MGKNIEINSLTQFGQMVARKLDREGIHLFEFAERVGSDSASMSRYLRLRRRPPSDLIDKIIDVLGFSERQGKKLHLLARRGDPASKRPALHASQSRLYLAMRRRFADYDLRALLSLIENLGWYCETNEDEDEYAYDLKVAESKGCESFVAVNFPNPHRVDPAVLLRGAGAMSGAYPDLQVTLYYEGVAGGLAAFKSEQSGRELPLEDPPTESTDRWLRQTSKGKGRVIHGGNVIQVLAEYLEPTDSVKDYLKHYS